MAETVADIAIGVTADIGPLMRETARAEAALGKFDRAVKGIGGRMTALGGQAMAFGSNMSFAAIAVGGVSAAVMAMVRNSANLGEAIANNSKAAGMSTTAYQEYAYALSEAADMSGEEFADATVKLNKRLGEAMAGSTAAQAAFEKLGISQADLASGAVTGDQAMAALVKTLETTSDPAVAAAIAAEVLGRSGARMGGMLAGTAGETDKLRESARTLGLVLSEDAVNASDDFNEAFDATVKQIEAMKVSIGTSLMPMMTDVLLPAIQETIPKIAGMATAVGEVKTAFDNLPAPVQSAIERVIGAINPLGSAADTLGAAWSKWGEDFKSVVGGAIDWVTGKFTAFMEKINAIVATLKDWKNTAADFIGAGDASTFTPNPNYKPDPLSNIGGGADVPGLGGGAGSDTLGISMADGMVNGLVARLAERSAEIAAAVDTIPQITRDQLGIKSPSTVFADIGMNIGEGLAQGIAASRSVVDATVKSMNDGALANTASFFDSMAAVTQAGGDKTNKAYRAFAAAEALINAYRAASQVLADQKLPFFAKFAAVASVLASGMGLVSALKGGGSSGGSSSGGGAAASSAASAAGPMSVANITLIGDTFSRDSIESLFSQINQGLKTGRTINLVGA